MWKAQYQQGNTWHDMNFNAMNVDARPGGQINGSGKDEVGEFTFIGTFSPNVPECRIHKQYQGAHSIFYQGQVNPQTGQINGSWGFKAGGSDGGFRMKRMG